jgi:hypothetical protein
VDNKQRPLPVYAFEMTKGDGMNEALSGGYTLSVKD